MGEATNASSNLVPIVMPQGNQLTVVVDVEEVRVQWEGSFGPFFRRPPQGSPPSGFSGLEVPPDILKVAAFVTQTPFKVDAQLSLTDLQDKIRDRFDSAAETLGTTYSLTYPPVRTGGGSQWQTAANDSVAWLAYSVEKDGAIYEHPYYATNSPAETDVPIGKSRYWILFSHEGIPAN